MMQQTRRKLIPSIGAGLVALMMLPTRAAAATTQKLKLTKLAVDVHGHPLASVGVDLVPLPKQNLVHVTISGFAPLDQLVGAQTLQHLNPSSVTITYATN